MNRPPSVKTRPRIIAIVGPTASGKTALAIQLAQAKHGSVISADSRQVFAGFNIGTAKPTEAYRATPHDHLTSDPVDGIPHYLLNIATPATDYSLAMWQQSALAVIEEISTHKRLPLLVGGTMLYHDSILYNYAIPEVPPNPTLRAQLEQLPTDTLYQRLVQKDPAAASFVEAHHQRRIIRALEVIEATGQPFSTTRQKKTSPYTWHRLGLFPGWDRLETNIQDRARMMLDTGLLDEVRTLQERFSPQLPLLHTMNYHQAALVLTGALSEAAAIEEIVRVNLRYAHRQMSWWKKQSDIQWYASPTPEEILSTLP